VLNKIVYRYIDRPRITRWVAEEILDGLSRGLGSIETTLDLGLSREKIVLEKEGVILRGQLIRYDELRETRYDRVYEVYENKLNEIVLRDRHIYILKPVSKEDAPTLEIDGIHMHRIKDVTPWIDSLMKVKVAKVSRGHVVLDTCMGLGYTAIHSLLRGARKVYTIEVDENVIEITMHNPWSRRLGDERVEVIKADATKAIHYFRDEMFDRIIHDPPRFSSRTGDLYSLEFYRELYRVLKPHGILFHYTGEPGVHGGPKIVKGVGDRLRKAGFFVKYNNKVKGFIAYKIK